MISLPDRNFVVSGLFAIALSVLTLTVNATEEQSGADSALNHAARLHKGGDTASALVIWREWAKRGNADAAYNLAVIHQHADGVPYDPAEAARWYRHAAERGDLVSQFQLGTMYQNGEGLPTDPVKAHEWFTRNRRAHVHHHHSAQFQQWQQQARALIDERDQREAAMASRRDGDYVLAELRRRAGIQPIADALGVGKLAAVMPQPK